MGASSRAVNPGVGGDSLILLALQERWGVPVRTFDAPSGDNEGFVQRRFIFTRNTLDPVGQFEQSESNLGDGTAPPSILARVVPEGQWEEELLPEDIVHFLRFGLNVIVDPSNTTLGTQAIAAADAANHSYSPDTNSVVAAQWPSIVRATFSGTTAGANASINFVGVGAKGATEVASAIETINIPAGADPDPIDSTLFFKRLTSVTTTGLTTPGTLQLDYIPDTEMVSMTPGSLSAGLVSYTSQMRKGNTPISAFDVVCGNTTITMGTNVRVLQDVRASRVLYNRLILDDSVEVKEWDDDTTPPGAPDLNNFGYANLNFARAWGTAVAMGTVDSEDLDTVDLNKIFTTNNVVLGINNNLEDSPGNTGNPSAGQPVVGAAGRQITLQIDKQYETGTDAYDWQSIFTSSASVPIVVRSYNFDGKGRQYLVEFRMASARLSAEPSVPVEDRGAIPQTLNFESNTVTVNIWSKNGFSNGSGE